MVESGANDVALGDLIMVVLFCSLALNLILVSWMCLSACSCSKSKPTEPKTEGSTEMLDLIIFPASGECYHLPGCHFLTQKTKKHAKVVCIGHANTALFSKAKKCNDWPMTGIIVL